MSISPRPRRIPVARRLPEESMRCGPLTPHSYTIDEIDRMLLLPLSSKDRDDWLDERLHLMRDLAFSRSNAPVAEAG